MNKPIQYRKWKNIALISVGMFATSTLTFNCAPSLFTANVGTVTGSSLGSSAGIDQFANVGRSPFALMSVNETFASMVNVTGLTNQVPEAMRAELVVRAGSLADTSLVTNVNAPLQLAATALAGEACNAAVERERGAGAERKFFRGVDFTKAPADQPATAFADSVGALARAFWNRAPTGEEMNLLETFRNEVPVGSTPAQTKGIYLGVCTAMLASFDAITY